MMTVVLNASGSYRIIHGAAFRTSALVVVPLLDEWTQEPPAGITAKALSPRAHARVTGSHLVITGLREQVLPNIDTAPAELTVELRRPGRPLQRVTVVVPMGSTLPYAAPVVAVTSTTIRLAGRVTAAAFPRPPIVGATIAIAGIGLPLVTLSVPLARRHAAGTVVRVRPLTPGAGTTLAEPVAGGAKVLSLASTAGIAPGAVLAVGRNLVVADATTGSLVLLRTSIAASAAAGTAVARQTLGAPGASVTLARDAREGDALLPASGALAGTVVEILDGAETEFRRTTLTTDSDGRWGVPVRGIPEIDLTTSAAGFLTDGPRRVPLAPIDPYTVNTSLRT